MGWGHCRAVGRDCVGSSWVLLIPTAFTWGMGLHLLSSGVNAEVGCAQVPSRPSLVPSSSSSASHCLGQHSHPNLL